MTKYLIGALLILAVELGVAPATAAPIVRRAPVCGPRCNPHARSSSYCAAATFEGIILQMLLKCATSKNPRSPLEISENILKIRL